MNFNKKAIGPGCYSGLGYRRYQCVMSGGMAGVDNYRQMAGPFEHRYGRNIQRKAHTVLECPDAALTEDDVVFTFRQQVIGGGQLLGDGAGKTAFQYHGEATVTGIGQQCEVLQITRTDL